MIDADFNVWLIEVNANPMYNDFGHHFLTHFLRSSQRYATPTRAVGGALLESHTCWVLIGACDPMLCPIHVFCSVPKKWGFRLYCSNDDIYNSVIKPAVSSTIDVVTDIFSRQSVRQRPMYGILALLF